MLDEQGLTSDTDFKDCVKTVRWDITLIHEDEEDAKMGICFLMNSKVSIDTFHIQNANVYYRRTWVVVKCNM